MCQDPIARVLGSQVSGVIVIRVEDMSECDEFSMTVSSIIIVVRSMRCIAPDSVTALFIPAAKSLDKLRKKYIHAFNHILALPAQLRNSVCRSLREKKRSRTGVIGGWVGTQWLENDTNRKRRQDASVQCLSFHRIRTLT